MAENTENTNAPEVKAGVFEQTLLRNNKQIRTDRAEIIIEDTEVLYRRKVEDIATKIKRKQRDQHAMLDLSPENAVSLTPNLKNYDPEKFVADHVKTSLELRELTIMFEEAKAGYEHLFGPFKSNE